MTAALCEPFCRPPVRASLTAAEAGAGAALLLLEQQPGVCGEGRLGGVTNGGVRDTDEIVKVGKPPVCLRRGDSTRGVRPGRMLTESYNFPINCGGVLVYPGNVVVAYGDGVIVVPRERALEVGRLVRQLRTGE